MEFLGRRDPSNFLVIFFGRNRRMKYKSVISIKDCLILRKLRMVNRYCGNWSAPCSNNVNRIRVNGCSCLLVEEKFLNQEISRNDIDGGEKIVVLIIK